MSRENPICCFLLLKNGLWVLIRLQAA